MADAKAIKSVKEIIESDIARRLIVVSAPGKRYAGDKKVTDLLLECHNELKLSGTCKNSFTAVRSRFTDIVRQLKLSLDINSVLDKIIDQIEQVNSEQFTASRGEYLCGIVMAEYFGMPFIDAADVIFFNNDGTLNADKTYKAIFSAVNSAGRAVIPGFYGVDGSGKIVTFSRGGSDITGALVARAVGAELYENWTDVSGFLVCDPKIADCPQTIETLTYKELRELSYMGANVLHSEAILPVGKANIPIQIKNTFRPHDAGTVITSAATQKPNGCAIKGIAGKKNFTIIDIEKPHINSGAGCVLKVLSKVELENSFLERISTGIDILSFIIKNSGLTRQKLNMLLKEIEHEIEPDAITVKENIALIATVGHGILYSAGTAARLLNAVEAADIEIRFVDMQSSGLNITLGVNEKDYERCIKAIYREFFEN